MLTGKQILSKQAHEDARRPGKLTIQRKLSAMGVDHGRESASSTSDGGGARRGRGGAIQGERACWLLHFPGRHHVPKGAPLLGWRRHGLLACCTTQTPRIVRAADAGRVGLPQLLLHKRCPGQALFQQTMFAQDPPAHCRSSDFLRRAVVGTYQKSAGTRAFVRLLEEDDREIAPG
jgi:hypothetical protein